MKTNCSCASKQEERRWNEALECWYVIRECEDCEYYWEGPIYIFDDPDLYGNTLE